VLPDGVNGTSYNTTLFATGGTGLKSWAVTAGTLPAGLSLTAATGAISGTPTATNATGVTFTVTVTDSAVPPVSATKQLTIRVADVLSITTVSLPDAISGANYSASLSSSGGLGSTSWTLASGNLPAGLTLNSSGAISGAPLGVGTSSFTVRAADSASPGQSTTKPLSIVVLPSSLAITTSFLPTAVANRFYSAIIHTNAPQAVVSLSIAPGFSVPPGMVLNSNGSFVGFPDTLGTFAFRVRASTSNNMAERDFTLTVTNSLPRNDTIAAATPLSNGSYRGTISPYTDAAQLEPDQDYYQFTANAGALVAVEIFAKRIIPGSSPLDSVIEVVDANGARFSTCRDAGNFSGVDGSPDPTPTAFDDVCLNDDLELGVTQDSKLEFQVPSSLGATVTFYVRVLDWGGRARPDFIYDLVVSGVN
jgi:hypothetical protein